MGVIKGNQSNTINRSQDVTTSLVGDKTALDVSLSDGSTVSLTPGSTGSLISEEWDSVTVTAKNADGCPTTIEYALQGSLIATITIVYDTDGDLQSVVRS